MRYTLLSLLYIRNCSKKRLCSLFKFTKVVSAEAKPLSHVLITPEA